MSSPSREAWIEREEAAVREWAARDDADVEHLWRGVEAGLSRRRFNPRWLAVPAAAAVALAVFWPRERETTRSAEHAMAAAQGEYETAIRVLEAKIKTQPAALGRARAGLARARDAARRDPAARVRLLEGYAAYLKSLRRTLQEESQ